MSMITPRAKDRCERESFQEQLENARRQMQRECGADDMKDVSTHLSHDSAKLNGWYMPMDGAD
jgi:hypothetical protein